MTGDDSLTAVARLLTAEAAYLCRSLEAALVVTAAGCIAAPDPAEATTPRPAGQENRILVPRRQVVRLGELSILQLLRFVGGSPVEVGTAEGWAVDELAVALRQGAAAGLFVIGDDPPVAEQGDMARFVWTCRKAGMPAVVLIAAKASPLAALDAGADLVLLDPARCHGGSEAGIVAGRTDLVRKVAGQERGIGALFRPAAETTAQVLGALAAAADPVAGMALPPPAAGVWSAPG